MRKLRELKIYGTRRRGHREKWYIKKTDKSVYREVRRDSKGQFISAKKWSSSNPISSEVFTETQPLIIKYTSGKDALGKVRQTVRQWEWVDFEAES